MFERFFSYSLPFFCFSIFILHFLNAAAQPQKLLLVKYNKTALFFCLASIAWLLFYFVSKDYIPPIKPIFYFSLFCGALLYFPLSTKKSLAVMKFVFIFISILNAIIFCSEMILSLIQSPMLAPLQDIFVARYNKSLAGITRKVMGLYFIRPVGLFGNLHLSGMVFVGSTLYWIMNSYYFRNIVRRICGYLTVFIITAMAGSGQNVIIAAAIILLFEFFQGSLAKRLSAVFILAPSALLAILLWLRVIGHLDPSKDAKMSMLSLYLQTFDAVKSGPISNCLLKGCGIELSDVDKLMLSNLEIPIRKGIISFTIVDNGFLNFSIVYGFPFLILLCLVALALFIKARRSCYHSQIAAFGTGYLLTILHYPTAFMATGMSFIILQFATAFYARHAEHKVAVNQ